MIPIHVIGLPAFAFASFSSLMWRAAALFLAYGGQGVGSDGQDL